jgi:hypothetical protein
MTKRTLVRRARTSDRESQAPPVQSFTQDRQTIHTVGRSARSAAPGQRLPALPGRACGAHRLDAVPARRDADQDAGQPPRRLRQRGRPRSSSPRRPIGSLIAASVTDRPPRGGRHAEERREPRQGVLPGRAARRRRRRGRAARGPDHHRPARHRADRDHGQDRPKRRGQPRLLRRLLPDRARRGAPAEHHHQSHRAGGRGRCGPRCAIGDSDPDHPTATIQGAFHARCNRKARAAREAESWPARTSPSQWPRSRPSKRGEDGTASTSTSTRTTPSRASAAARSTPTPRPASRASSPTWRTMGETVTELAGLVRDRAPPAARRADATPAPGRRRQQGPGARLPGLREQAEVLVPGFKVPTFDSALPRAKTVDAMCAGRRAVLTTFASAPRARRCWTRDRRRPGPREGRLLRRGHRVQCRRCAARLAEQRPRHARLAHRADPAPRGIHQPRRAPPVHDRRGDERGQQEVLGRTARSSRLTGTRPPSQLQELT